MTEYEDRQAISDVVNRFDGDLVRTADGWRIDRRVFTQVRLAVSDR